MKITRDVVTDLLPLYESGEASPDTRALVEAYFRPDPDFEQLAKAARTTESRLHRAGRRTSPARSSSKPCGGPAERCESAAGSWASRFSSRCCPSGSETCRVTGRSYAARRAPIEVCVRGGGWSVARLREALAEAEPIGLVNP